MPDEEILEDTLADEEYEETTDGEEAESAEGEESSEEDGEELVVTLGDNDESSSSSKGKSAPEWVRELRKAHQQTQKENRELRAQLEANARRDEPVNVGAKPTLEDFDYDQTQFESALMDWMDRKRQAEAQAKKAEEEEKAEAAKRQEEENAWQEQLKEYAGEKTRLTSRLNDFDDAEAVALNTLNETQQGLIVQGAKNPALLIYALGKNPARMKELAKITDPVKFAFTVAKLEEKELKVNKRKPPPPERTPRNSGGTGGKSEKHLERLRAQAVKTGDYTEVLRYKDKLAKEEASR